MAFTQGVLDNNLQYNDNRYIVKTDGVGLQTVDTDINFTGTITFNGGSLGSLYYLKTEYINVSTGIPDAGKPIVLDAAGKIDTSMLHGGDTTYKLISPDGLIDPVISADNAGDLVAVGNFQLNGDLRVDGHDIGLSSDTNLMQLTNNLVTVNGQVKAYGTAASMVIDATGANDAYFKFYLDTIEKASLTVADIDNKFYIAAPAGIYFSNDATGGNLIATTKVITPQIGCAADNDLLQLSLNVLSLYGSLIIENQKYIGSFADPDLLQFWNGALFLNGDLHLNNITGSNYLYANNDHTNPYLTFDIISSNFTLIKRTRIDGSIWTNNALVFDSDIPIPDTQNGYITYASTSNGLKIWNKINSIPYERNFPFGNLIDDLTFPTPELAPQLLWNEQDEALYIGATGINGKWVQVAGGIVGATGIQGETGLVGLTGLRGITGAYGGPQGITGIQGIQGDTGIQGATGLPGGGTGLQGVTGPAGAPQGDTGIQGITGLRGQTGIQGIQGNTGIQGITGLIGNTGIQGITGLRGQTGIQGIQGNTGIQGSTGVPGFTGIQGRTGIQGITGTRGITGIQGNTGIQGITGLRGQTGLGTTGLQGETGIAGFTDTDWIDYTASSVITGWAAGLTASIKYKNIGSHLRIVNFEITGTSNSVNTTFTLPNPACSYTSVSALQFTNNTSASTTAGLIRIPGTTNTVYCYRDWNYLTWTASGTKTVQGTILYEI